MLYAVCKQEQNLQYTKRLSDVCLFEGNSKYASNRSTSAAVSHNAMHCNITTKTQLGIH